MTAHGHSLLAMEELRASGELSKRQALILSWLLGRPRAEGWTDREVAEGLRLPDMNCARPRLTELRDMGLLEECGKCRCPVTGKTVRRLRPAARQGELF